ncbi:MAG: hypothetical protein FVQ80_11130 [Planctomycetes bacterium]|nr:hypothetical protein [Planctomycetota bacterium]
MPTKSVTETQELWDKFVRDIYKFRESKNYASRHPKRKPKATSGTDAEADIRRSGKKRYARRSVH